MDSSTWEARSDHRIYVKGVRHRQLKLSWIQKSILLVFLFSTEFFFVLIEAILEGENQTRCYVHEHMFYTI